MMCYAAPKLVWQPDCAAAGIDSAGLVSDSAALSVDWLAPVNLMAATPAFPPSPGSDCHEELLDWQYTLRG